jgi:phospholipid/cholesterol/gamma-HCH transport system substrate-binding protein
MKREREVILGAMVFFGIAILVLGAAWLSDNYWGPSGGYKIVAAFESVHGLNKGNPVTLRGVQVGKVLEIQMGDQGRPMVLVGFRDLRDLPRDSKIILRSVGMLGERTVEVRMGTSTEVFKDGDMAVGSSELGMVDMTADFAEMTNRIKAVVDSMTSPENISRMTNSLRNMDTTTATLRNLLARNESKLNTTIENLAAASEDASGLIRESKAKLERSVGNLDAATTDLATASKRIADASGLFESTMRNLDDITAKINRGEGTLGRLVNDPKAYDGLTHSIANADSLIEAIKKDPGRYLNFKFTIF